MRFRIVVWLLAGVTASFAFADASAYANVTSRSRETADRFRRDLVATGGTSARAEITSLWRHRCVLATRTNDATVTIRMVNGRCP